MNSNYLAQTLDLPKRAVALVLAGGRGSRLQSLTDRRAKPAVYFGGKFRIIDFALSNCLNSGIRRIGVITQYKSHSLLRHLQRGWAFLKTEMNEFVDLLPAQQRMDEESWYRGTADAVSQNQDILDGYGADYVVVLAGDHVYKMNYALMLADHAAMGKPCTVGCIEVPRMEATAFGVMHVDAQRNILDFVEKPADPPPMPGKPDRALASMGIYIFDARYLYEALKRDMADDNSNHDFGKDIIPRAVREGNAVAHPFGLSCVGTLPGQEHVLARRGHDRRLLGRQHRPHRDRSAAQHVRHALADPDLPAAVAAGEVRTQPGRPPRHGNRISGVGRLHHLGPHLPLSAVFQRARAFVRVGGVVGAAAVGGSGPRRAPEARCHRPRLRAARRHGHR